MQTLLRSLPVCLLVTLVSAPAWATGVPDYLTARGIGLGGTRALGFGNEAIFLNPASMGVVKQYTMQLDYGHATAPNESLSSGDGVVVSIGDSMTNPKVASGIAYRYASLEAGGKKQSGSITDFAIASALSDKLWLGLKLSYLSFTNSGIEVKKITGDLGMTAIVQKVAFSLVGFNLIAVNNPQSARGVSVGAAFTNGSTFSMGGDVRWQFLDGKAPRTYAAGGEYILGKVFPIRAGYMHDGIVNGNFVTVGTGFYTKQFGFDATYRRNLNTAEGVWMFAAKIFGGNQGGG